MQNDYCDVLKSLFPYFKVVVKTTKKSMDLDFNSLISPLQ